MGSDASDPAGEPSLRLVIPLEDESENRWWVQIWRLFVPKQGGPAENPVRKLRARTLEALGGTACLFDAASGSYRPVPGTP